MSRIISLNLRITAILIILIGIYEWIFEPGSIKQQYYVPGPGRAATALTGHAALKVLALLTGLGWLAGRMLSDSHQRQAGFVFGPLCLFPQLVAGCIVHMEYPERGVPGMALILGFYLLFSLILFILRPRNEWHDD
jgi:hypothetical protein